jgi:hypothetical protein
VCPNCRSDKYTLHRCAVGVRYVGQCSGCGYTAYETVSVRSLLEMQARFEAARESLERITDGVAKQILSGAV